MSIINRHLPTPSTEEMSEPMRYALGVVEQMGVHGLTAVPVKPSMDMLLAGARAGAVSVETAWNIYTAMLRSAE